MNRLKERRLELGLTQEAVSSVLKLGDPRIAGLKTACVCPRRRS